MCTGVQKNGRRRLESEVRRIRGKVTYYNTQVPQQAVKQAREARLAAEEARLAAEEARLAAEEGRLAAEEGRLAAEEALQKMLGVKMGNFIISPLRDLSLSDRSSTNLYPNLAHRTLSNTHPCTAQVAHRMQGLGQ
eukprot:TRINITY_DN259_c0_g1_i5.p1 TRINITY_DN259_c0_g1~~TRINITY_DN259_c0_g1_i5.p1  ORF type:complete len:136 (-),score=16.18 TRINITY_DN259_c0_g1_i5:87-494(-)